jgi:hypothetical protein
VRPRAALVVLALAAAVAAHADDVPVAVRAHVEPDTVAIGRRFRYVLEVDSRPDAEVFVTQPSERIGDFDIVDFGIAPAAQRDGRTVLTRWYTLVGYTPGHHLVKSPPVHFRQPGEELQEAPGAETRVSIESALEKAGNPTDIRDIKGPEQVPIDPRPYYLLAAAVLVLVAAFVLYRILRRPRRSGAVAPPRPPHELAAEALEQLRQRGLVREGAFKEYYSALSAIVRTYVERRFEIRAPEMTTEEFLLASARRGRLVGPHRALLTGFLTESDLVKFARHLPTIADSERAWTAARRFVDETAATAAPERIRAAG